MKAGIIIISLLLFCSNCLIQAQSKEIMAKSAMINADQSYENGQYKECLDYLKEAETNLGKTNSRIQYLKVKSLYSLGTQNGYNREMLGRAEQELKKFFDITSKSSYVPEKYDELLLLAGQFKKLYSDADAFEQRKAEEKRQIIMKAEIEQKQKDESAYNIAKKINTAESYKNYLDNFPKGKYFNIAKEQMESIILVTQRKEQLMDRWNCYYWTFDYSLDGNLGITFGTLWYDHVGFSMGGKVPLRLIFWKDLTDPDPSYESTNTNFSQRGTFDLGVTFPLAKPVFGYVNAGIAYKGDYEKYICDGTYNYKGYLPFDNGKIGVDTNIALAVNFKPVVCNVGVDLFNLKFPEIYIGIGFGYFWGRFSR